MWSSVVWKRQLAFGLAIEVQLLWVVSVSDFEEHLPSLSRRCVEEGGVGREKEWKLEAGLHFNGESLEGLEVYGINKQNMNTYVDRMLCSRLHP